MRLIHECVLYAQIYGICKYTVLLSNLHMYNPYYQLKGLGDAKVTLQKVPGVIHVHHSLFELDISGLVEEQVCVMVYIYIYIYIKLF